MRQVPALMREIERASALRLPHTISEWTYPTPAQCTSGWPSSAAGQAVAKTEVAVQEVCTRLLIAAPHEIPNSCGPPWRLELGEAKACSKSVWDNLYAVDFPRSASLR